MAGSRMPVFVVGVWAALCLGGLAATSALNAEPATEEPKPRATAVFTAVVDCEQTADEIERSRTEAQETRQPSGEPTVVEGLAAVPAQCADELDERGLR